MGGRAYHVIVASGVTPAAEAPEQTPPLQLRAISGQCEALPQRMKTNQKSGVFASGIGYSERPRNFP